MGQLVQAGVNVFGRQGFPTVYYVGAITDDALHSAPDLQIGPATNYRTPNVYQLDFQLSRDFIFGSKITVTPILACFNLTDGRTVLARVGHVGDFDSASYTAFSPDQAFNSVAEELGPRTFRGGVRIFF